MVLKLVIKPRVKVRIKIKNKLKRIGKMTQKEFEGRIGREVTGDEFERANDLYIMSGELDKDRFCADYKKHEDSEIIASLFDTADKQKDKLHVLTNERNGLVNFLIDQAEKYSSAEMRDKAVSMVGETEYLRRKIHKGYGLWKVDRQALEVILCGAVLPPPVHKS